MYEISWAVLDGPWEVLGVPRRSWEVLGGPGRSWEALGRSWDKNMALYIRART